jgi:hypothetical protein
MTQIERVTIITALTEQVNSPKVSVTTFLSMSVHAEFNFTLNHIVTMVTRQVNTRSIWQNDFMSETHPILSTIIPIPAINYQVN